MDEAQAGIKIAGRNINNLRYADDTTLMAESEEELKNLVMKVKEESEKAGLKLNIQKTKIMASDPIASWQIEEKIGLLRKNFFYEQGGFIGGPCKQGAQGAYAEKPQTQDSLKFYSKGNYCVEKISIPVSCMIMLFDPGDYNTS